ncbi:DUF1178 domain-containing protein [Prosthecomicrobium hirschii]|uniref:DUF1178 family protein n=1 Tax=Prosthecodimorpha hirschii TaxID=665126 RepID=UPI0011264657|nr:DUF1178 family protein [Prosthecomicrobium hirschii]TPQ48916.1 DUF1178 domain-containing protein [Prosthecomicrobium hirschii]
MIHYALICPAEHEFEGWFRSSSDFEAQAAAGHVSCPVCGSTQVARALMAPNVQPARGRAAVPAAETGAGSESAPAAASAPVPVPVPAAPPPALVAPHPAQAVLLAALKEIRAKVLETADYVGTDFAEEARRIHYGESEQRGIYGEASAEEAEALIEEGIDVHALPILPDDRN